MELMLGLGLLGALFGWGVVGWWRYGEAKRELEKVLIAALRERVEMADVLDTLAGRLETTSRIDEWLREAEDHAAEDLR